MTDLEKAISLREKGEATQALAILDDLLVKSPEDPTLNYHAAWTCDSMGAERAALPYYEAAIANGLEGEELRGAFLGLGSTYRCVGEYENSLQVFDRAIEAFPNDKSLQIFRALTLYNLGKASETIEILLLELIDSTSDKNIRRYDRALRFYADKLDEIWT